MIRILIADDEKWIRAIIKDVIYSSSDKDYIISGEASDGQEALDLVLDSQPDILLTDIRMPELDGLELMKEVIKLNPHLKIVFISGYDEFEYAQRALKLGAFDYLLKPIEEAYLLEVLNSAKEAIYMEREKQASDQLLKIQHEAGFNLLRENFLSDILKGTSLTIDEFNKQSKHLGLVFDKPVFGVMTISLDDYRAKTADLTKPQVFSLVSALKTSLNRVAKKYLKGYCLCKVPDDNEINILFNNDAYLTKEYISDVFNIIQKLMRRHFNVSCSAGVSSQQHGISKISALYAEAVWAIKYKMIYGLGCVLFYEDIQNIKVREIALSKDLAQEISLNLELRNFQNASSILDGIFIQLDTYKDSTPVLIKNTLWKFLLDIISKLDCKVSLENKLYGFDQNSVYEEFKRMETLGETKAYLKNLFKSIVNNHMQNESGYNNAVESAKKFISANYYKDISLELMANYVYLNPSYFSELFKKETGRNFIEYLTGVRINRAKELLKNTGLKSYEVCEAVGYTDSKYFSKLFKKIVGVTPSEYKGSL